MRAEEYLNHIDEPLEGFLLSHRKRGQVVKLMEHYLAHHATQLNPVTISKQETKHLAKGRYKTDCKFYIHEAVRTIKKQLLKPWATHIKDVEKKPK